MSFPTGLPLAEHSTPHVLIVEDDAATRRPYKFLLTNGGYAVLEAEPLRLGDHRHEYAAHGWYGAYSGHPARLFISLRYHDHRIRHARYREAGVAQRCQRLPGKALRFRGARAQGAYLLQYTSDVGIGVDLSQFASRHMRIVRTDRAGST